jgi:phage tail-like protein
MAERTTPYSSYNFTVSINGGRNKSDALGGFSEVSGLNSELTLAEYRNGNDKEMHVRKVPGLHKVGDITLKRGVVNSSDLWSWMKDVRTQSYGGQRNVEITLNDEAGAKVQTWKLTGCVPMKFTGPTLTGKGGGDVAMEELTLSAEGVDLESHKG